MSDADYIDGRQSAFRSLLSEISRELGHGSVEQMAAADAAEIIDTRRALRKLCEELGCNEWEDDLWLPDVIEKHLARTIDDRAGYNAAEDDE